MLAWMFRVVLSVSPTIYAFISGLLISVATSAATMISFADESTPIHPSVSWTGFCAFLAGSLWFVQSENVTSLRRNIDVLAQASKSWANAANAQSTAAKRRTLILLAAGVVLTLIWPFLRILFW